MGAFNELICGDVGDELRIQFKHGMRRQYEYRLGDRISWETQPRPSFADGTVIVPGLGARHMSDQWLLYAITFEDDVIKSVKEISETEYDRLGEEFDRLASRA